MSQILKKEPSQKVIDFAVVEFNHNADTLIESLGIEESEFCQLMVDMKKYSTLSEKIEFIVNSNIPEKLKVLAIFHYGFIQGTKLK